MKKAGIKNLFCLMLVVFAINITGCEAAGGKARNMPSTDYGMAENWAYHGVGEGKDADVFLVCPTVDMKDEWNMSLDDEETKADFLGALNMERGIYEDSARLYAPYYRQAAMKVYELEETEREPYLDTAYGDVSAAFSYYLENYNQDRPVILAGFSQGADMCYRLMMEYFGDEKLSDRLVAVYAIGWALTDDMTAKYPQLKAASGETDTGVVISFECEADSVGSTFIIPEGTKALSINPLNWRTDGTLAAKEENAGACFTDYDGNIVTEAPALCGGYIDADRGVLKVTDIRKEDYPAVIPELPDGAYHIYDYQFFYRNLQENVKVRLDRYLMGD